jgi:hypothetical protein
VNYYAKDLGAGAQLIQAHVPPAIAKLLGRSFPDQEVVDTCKKLFANDLAGKGRARYTLIPQSCALALGQLCQSVDDATSPDAGYANMLLDVWLHHQDSQARHFAAIALGQIGGNLVRAALTAEFANADDPRDKAWLAMAMGVFAHARLEATRGTQVPVEIDADFGRLLQRALRDVSEPSARGAFAVALGLIGYRDAAGDMRALLTRVSRQDEPTGYLCLGLALMHDSESIDDIRALVRRWTRRPDLLRQAVIALGLPGDRRDADMLQELLAEGDTNLAKLSALAGALGLIGDRSSIEPLEHMLHDESLYELPRAFAAVALGCIADKESLPWNSRIGQNVNYRAAVETLTDMVSAAGILDIR